MLAFVSTKNIKYLRFPVAGAELRTEAGTCRAVGLLS
jgi:hypothetical protein